MTTFTESVQKGTPYRTRLRAAYLALAWWRPWHSYYGLLSAAQYEGMHGYDRGYADGVRHGETRAQQAALGKGSRVGAVPQGVDLTGLGKLVLTAAEPKCPVGYPEAHDCATSGCAEAADDVRGYQ